VFLEGIEMEQQMVLPEGGLASFLTSNLDEIDDSRLAFGRQNGINSMRETAERMAQLGRNGDDVLIHATKKERLIPKEVSEANPELMTQVDIAIADAGADPSAYIVGSETNSVNPYTGQREFFLKKIISGVKKVFKAVAPIVVPFALNFIAPGLGAVTSGFIGGGITGLVQGKSFKDSLKMGLIGGALGGISQGFSNYRATGDIFKSKDVAGSGGFFGTSKINPKTGNPYKTFELRQPQDVVPKVPDSTSTSPVFDKLKDTFYNAPVEANPGMNLAAAKTEVLAQFPELAKDSEAIANLTLQRVGAGATDAIPGSVKLIPTAATILAGGAALGGFDPIDPAKVEDPYSKESASERRLRLNRNKYASGPNLPQENLTLQDIMVSSVPQLYDQYLNPQRVAAGGEMDSFPRRTGYIEGPGTETSDDIPAMLSDGEFVMNAKAVRGAGGGSREKGVRRMYDMMRAFEGGAVA
jgi:hypothetical protein